MQQNIADYEQELKQLRNQQKKDRRDADEVTQTMITECQQLLALFGLPYVTAPMEAEAQCATLVQLGLVDGIVTDDSDVFLFGGTRVYKNVFNQAKFVECYLTNDLESEFGLTRQRLIAIAQLLGSDYTEGLQGIGPVTALEILSEFDDLTTFKEWWIAVQQGSRSKDLDASSPFRKKFRRNAAKIFLPLTFPDPRVEGAYLQPEVDKDPSAFMWGVPDLAALRSFLMSTIGWTNERVDEILVPVIRDLNRREQEGTQANITRFFSGGIGAGAAGPRKRGEGSSKRLESALHKIGDRAKGRAVETDGDVTAEVEASPAKAQPKNPAGRKTKRAAAPAATAEDGTTADDDDDDDFVEPRKKARKTAKGRRKKPDVDEDDDE
jgi:DNA excision repair protein ERCC-5